MGHGSYYCFIYLGIRYLLIVLFINSFVLRFKLNFSFGRSLWNINNKYIMFAAVFFIFLWRPYCDVFNLSILFGLMVIGDMTLLLIMMMGQWPFIKVNVI